MLNFLSSSMRFIPHCGPSGPSDPYGYKLLTNKSYCSSSPSYSHGESSVFSRTPWVNSYSLWCEAMTVQLQKAIVTIARSRLDSISSLTQMRQSRICLLRYWQADPLTPRTMGFSLCLRIVSLRKSTRSLIRVVP